MIQNFKGIKGKILVIDDKINWLEAVTIPLETEGYSVIFSDEPEEGMEKAFKEKPDLILLDIMMPKFSGVQVLKILKDRLATKNISVIMLTAKHDKETVLEAIKAGAVDYCVKPFDSKTLLKKIEKALRGKKI